MECKTFRNGQTVNKKRYPTRKKAYEALIKTCARRGWPLNRLRVYRCGCCGKFHYGRKNYKEFHGIKT